MSDTSLQNKLRVAITGCILILFISAASKAQSVSGTVRSASDNQPLPGVTVHVSNSAVGTVTDNQGYYQLEGVSSNDTLIFSFIGYEKLEHLVGNQKRIDISLIATSASLDQLVVIGYGSQKEKDLTGAITSIKNEKLDQIPTGAPGKALAGRLSGVTISNSNNDPGSAPTIRIRGYGSISAGNSPLVVIDGIPGGSLQELSMNDIESIEVLKDASSAAIYGSRGSGGVIMVTTKRGQKGKPQLELDAYYGISKAILHDDWLMGKEWYNYLVKYQNREFAWTGGDVSLPMFGDPRRPQAYQVNPLTYELPQTNWQDEVMHIAPYQNYSLSVKGGTDNVKYYVSGNYMNEKGTLKTSSYKKYSFRANINLKVNDYIDLGFELNPSFSRKRTPGSNMLSLAKYPPFVPATKESGKYPRTLDYIPFGHSSQASPYTFLYGTENFGNTFTNIGRAFATISILNGLTLKSSLGTNLSFNKSNYWRGGIGDKQVSDEGHIIKSNTVDLINENVINYEKTFNNKHNIDAIIGASFQRVTSGSSRIYAVSNSFNNDKVKTLNNAIINPSNTTQSETEWGLISYFGRINYNFESKYLFSVSLRTDGSSRFGPKNKWGLFPSASAGWRISEENFMKNNSIISNLKLRGDYGVTGNFNIGNFQYLGAVSTVRYSPNNETVNGLAQSSIDNPHLSWERSKGFDIGLDMGFFRDRISLSLDYYDNRTEGMLYNVNVPAITGFNDAIRNIGKIRNRGFEAEIKTINFEGPFKWSTSFNFSYNKNEVLDLGGVDQRLSSTTYTDWILKIGVPMFSFYGYKIIGVFQNQDEIDKFAHLAGTKPGNPRVQDTNGDGKIDPEDKVVLGNFMPKERIGLGNSLSWRNFDLSFFVNVSLGAKIYNIENQSFEGNTLGAMRRSLAVRQWWSEDDPGDGKSPAAALSQLFGYNSNTDFYIEDASYLKISNINLGYNFHNTAKSIGISNLRLYISLNNLLYITSKDFHGYNPEGYTGGEVSGINSTPGINYGTVPLNRTYGLGINVTF